MIVKLSYKVVLYSVLLLTASPSCFWEKLVELNTNAGFSRARSVSLF
jgi:hypothetical protein